MLPREHMLDREDVELTIEVLRRRLDAAVMQGKPRALIQALEETLADFEAGRMPRRYELRRLSVGGRTGRE